MNKSTLMTVFVGAALMVWGGSSITAGLGFTDWHQVNVALFAIGIILLAQVPYLSLRARIRKWEAVRSLGRRAPILRRNGGAN